MRNMMLHLGGNDMIPLSHIVAILDVRAAQARDTAAYLKKMHLPPDARSIVITHAYGKSGVRLSNISAQTLLRRHQGVKT